MWWGWSPWGGLPGSGVCGVVFGVSSSAVAAVVCWEEFAVVVSALAYGV